LLANFISVLLLYLIWVRIHIFLSPTAQEPLVDHGFPIVEASRSHSDTPHAVRLLWTNDQPD